MSANITIPLPLETIAAIQSSAGPGLTQEILEHVSPALIQAAKDLPVTFIPRNGNQNNSSRANDAAVTKVSRPASDSETPAAKRRLVSPKNAFNCLLREFGCEAPAPRAQPLPSVFEIQVIPRGEPDRILKVNVLPHQTMATLKKMIARVWGDVDMENQSLSRQQGSIRDSDTFSGAGIQPNTTIYLDPGIMDVKSKQVTPQPNALVTARSLTGKALSFNVPLSTTVEKMKLLIEGSEGIPPDQQRLFFQGKQSDEGLYPEDDGYHENQGRTPAMYGVEDGSVIHITIRLSGS